MPHSIINDFNKYAQNLHNCQPNWTAKKKKEELKKKLKIIKKELGKSPSKENRRAIRKVKDHFIQYQFHWKIEAKWIANPILFDSSQNKLRDLKKKTIKLQKKKSRIAKAKRNAITALYNELILNHNKSNPALEWTAKKIDCVELAYALYAAKVFNHGKAELTQIMKAIQILTNLTIIHPNRMFIDIQNRKKEQTKFSNELTSALLHRINENENEEK